MRKILIPVDGSRQSEAAVRAVVAQARREPIAAIHVLNVQPRMSAYVTRFVRRSDLREFQREEGERALEGARRILENAGLRYEAHLERGPAARTAARMAERLGVDEIVMGADGGGFLANIRLWILVMAMRRHARVPVMLVMNPERTGALGLPLGRWGSTVPR